MEETVSSKMSVEARWNVMSHVEKPDFVSWQNGQVHLKRRGRQFSWLLAAKVCASAVVMVDTPCSEIVWRVLATHCILPVSPMKHRVPSHFNWSLLPTSSNGVTCQKTLPRHSSPTEPQILYYIELRNHQLLWCETPLTTRKQKF